MDKNGGSCKMIKIELRKEGNFLSGRSKAFEIINEYDPKSLTNESIVIDFTDIEACAQSFISELIFQLKQRGVRCDQIKCKSVSDSFIQQRIDKELKRFGLMVSS